DEPWIDDSHSDACSFQLELEAFGEIDHCSFARAVAAVLGPTRVAEQRAHDGDMSRLALEHSGQRGSDGVDHAVDIEFHRAVKAVEIDIADIERRIHPGPEQGEIYGAERGFDPRH